MDIASLTFRIARTGLHRYEEPCISGENGSGTVFFSGCDMRCPFCQNAEISHGGKGVNVNGEELLSTLDSDEEISTSSPPIRGLNGSFPYLKCSKRALNCLLCGMGTARRMS